MTYRHAAVWLDSREAHVFRLIGGEFVETLARWPEHLATSNYGVDELSFFAAIARLLRGAHGIILAGPSPEKDRFRRYVLDHALESPLAIERVELISSPSSFDFERSVRDYLTTERRAGGALLASAEVSPSYRCG